MNLAKFFIFTLVILLNIIDDGFAKKIGKCSCAVKAKCAEGLKDHAPMCYKMCQEKANLKELAPNIEESGLQKCLDLRIKLFNETLKCSGMLGGGVEVSCVKGKDKGPDIEQAIDSDKIIEEEVVTYMGAAYKTLKDTSGPAAAVVDGVMSIGLCAWKCMSEAQLKGKCHAKNNCELEMNPALVKESMSTCFSYKEICECYKNAGISELGAACGST